MQGVLVALSSKIDQAVEMYLKGFSVTEARGVSSPPLTTYIFYKALKERGIELRGRLSRRSEVPENSTLQCKKCGRIKGTKCFSKHKGTVSGYDTSRCLSCKRSEQSWLNTSIEKRILNRLKARAKSKGIPFTLTLEDIVLPEKCPVFDKPFIYGDHYWTYSVDRLNPDKGYTKDNIAIISNKANMMKSTASKEEILKLYLWLKNVEN